MKSLHSIPSPSAFALAFACTCSIVGTAYAQAPTETIIHNFAFAPQGVYPVGGLLRDDAGNFYGTAESGGLGGVVFEIDARGRETILHRFTGGADGGNPSGQLARDSEGNLYGTTLTGGTGQGGVVYKLGPAGKLTVLSNFAEYYEGTNLSGVVRDRAGNLYGAAEHGGPEGYGEIYKLDAAGNQTVLHNFCPHHKIGCSDGSYPQSAPIVEADGTIYGTASSGGEHSSGGVLYKVDPAGHYKIVYTFFGVAYTPIGGVIRDAEGNFYGASSGGGAANAGTVYKIDTTGTLTVLYAFTGGNDGANPASSLVFDAAGNLYGTTPKGGANGDGVVYQVNPSGQETVLHTFTGGTDGAMPESGLTIDPSGNLYGTAAFGGQANIGVVFRIDPAGQQTLLVDFSGGAGNDPFSSLIQDAAGNYYGTTSGGGRYNSGAVFKIDPSGKQTFLYSFTGGADGSGPWAGVTLDSVGNLYGTTLYGGHPGAGYSSCGVVYKIDPSGQETVLHTFAASYPDGCMPFAGVTLDSSGNLYGATFSGGAFVEGVGYGGVVYKLDPSGNETVLHVFEVNYEGQGDAFAPYGGLTLDSQGNLWGTTSGGGFQGDGAIYEIPASGGYLLFFSFTYHIPGWNPNCNLAIDAQGNLYGTTGDGGSAGYGTVFQITPSGQGINLYTFQGGTDGANPQGAVAVDSQGNVYGTTTKGGASNAGTVFEVSPSGQETILHSFTGGVDGGYPYGGVMLNAAGNLVGTAQVGGKRGGGVIFEIQTQ